MRNSLLRIAMAIRHRTLAVLVLGLIGACAGATAQAQEPGWVTDSFSGCRSWDPYGSYFTPANYIIYDETTLHADLRYVRTAAIDEEVWTSLTPEKLIAAAENSFARSWTFGAALLYIKVIEFHPNGPEARAAQDGLAHIKTKDPRVAVMARRLHMMVNSGTNL